MTIEEAARILGQMYEAAGPAREQTTAVHLFGIKYSDEIQNMPLRELAVRAGISEKYQTEIRKGMRLSKYVSMKDS